MMNLIQVINLFGHTHQTTNFYNDNPYMYHVGVDSHDCYPVLLEDILESIKIKRRKPMFYKLMESHYLPESGESIAIIKTKYGDFAGYAKLHPEDFDIKSEFTGCAFAETRAIAKAHRAELKEKELN